MLELDAKEIFSAINLNEPKKLIGIKLFNEINSTNDYLKKNNLAGQQPLQVVIAEHQTAGLILLSKTSFIFDITSPWSLLFLSFSGCFSKIGLLFFSK